MSREAVTSDPNSASRWRPAHGGGRGDVEECALRDHLLAAHPKTLQPETRSALLRHFVVTEPPRQQRSRAQPATELDLAKEFGAAPQLDLGGEEEREAFETRGHVGFHLTSETVTGRARENGNGTPPFPAARVGWQ